MQVQCRVGASDVRHDSDLEPEGEPGTRNTKPATRAGACPAGPGKNYPFGDDDFPPACSFRQVRIVDSRNGDALPHETAPDRRVFRPGGEALFKDQLCQAVEAARGTKALDDVSRLVWRGMSQGVLDDDDAQMIAELIHARRESLKEQREASRPKSIFPPRRPQRAPVRAEAIARRRRLAASGPLPPSIAARFTVGEAAVMRIVGDECRDRGFCALSLAAIAARAGVCRKLAQNAIRLAKRNGLLAVQERPCPGKPHLTNVITVVSAEWQLWLFRSKGGERRGGGKKIAPTDTDSIRDRKVGAGSTREPLRSRHQVRMNGVSRE